MNDKVEFRILKHEIKSEEKYSYETVYRAKSQLGDLTLKSREKRNNHEDNDRFKLSFCGASVFGKSKQECLDKLSALFLSTGEFLAKSELIDSPEVFSE